MFLNFVISSVMVVMVTANCGPCPEIPKHYEELGCKGIQHQGDCCPERFDCPNFLAYNKSQCHYKGKAYDLNEELDSGVGPSCAAGCKCLGFSETATFSCADIECPEFFNRPDRNCLLQRSALNQCCSSSKTCGAEEIAALPTCSLRGKTYRKGELIYPEFAPCYQCLCNEEFDNSTSIPLNKNCAKINCGIELRKLDEIQSGCIPVYYGENGCCPIEYRCPTDTDSVIHHEGRSDPIEESDSTCTFNKFILRRGEHLNSDDKCVECTCRFPPMVDCVKIPKCYEDRNTVSNITEKPKDDQVDLED